MVAKNIVFFSPISWGDLQLFGPRKTAGAMFSSLWNESEIDRLWFVQRDYRWGVRATRTLIDTKVNVIGLPIGLPYERFKIIRKINRAIQACLLTRLIFKSNHYQNDLVYWSYDWLELDIVRRLPRYTTIMELTDSSEQFYGKQPDMLRQLLDLRRIATELVDIMFVVSQALQGEAVQIGRQAIVRPNGISAAFLDRAATLHPEPEVLKDVPRPRLCVVGTNWSLNYRVDHQLLIDALASLPEWSLILIGCDSIETAGLRRLVRHSQVFSIGMLPQHRLVENIQHCDVCAVPYVQGPAQRDTLKIYEYLACSRPVILTADEVVDPLQPFVRRVVDATSFADACRELSSQEWGERLRAAPSVLREMTWDKRASACLAIVNERLRCGVRSA